MSTPSTSGVSDPIARHSSSPRELEQMLALDRSGAPFIALRDGDGALRLIALDAGAGIITVGRRPGMDISIPWDAEVSGLHAELRPMGDEWTVADDGLSRNGTFLNGERLGGRQRLRAGDRLLVGRTVIAFCQSAAESPEATVASGTLPEAPPISEMQRKVLNALCRPCGEGGGLSVPASNQQIADEVFLGVDAVKRHLRTLFQRFGLAELSQNQKRARLAEVVMQLGIVSRHDLTPGRGGEPNSADRAPSA